MPGCQGTLGKNTLVGLDRFVHRCNGTSWLRSANGRSSRLTQRSEPYAVAAAAAASLSLGASGNSSSHLWAVTSLAGFGAADRQRKSLSPVCWVGSHPQRAIRHRLYDSAGSLRCWHSSTARPRLKLRVRIHSAVVGQSSEDSHAAAIRERDAHNWGALSGGVSFTRQSKKVRRILLFGSQRVAKSR